MNLQYWKIKLHGAPYRCGDGGGDGGGGDIGASPDAGIGGPSGGSSAPGASDGSHGTDVDASATNPDASDPGSNGFDGFDPNAVAVAPVVSNTSIPGLSGTAGANLSQDQINDAVATMQSAGFQQDSISLAIAVTGSFGQDPTIGDSLGMHSPGISYADLAVASALGMGSSDVNSGQTVAQAMAAQTVHSYINQNLGSLIGQLTGSPVLGAIATMANALAQGHSLANVFGYAGASIVGTAISQATGLPVSGNTVVSVAQGNVGQAAISMAINSVAQSSGLTVSQVTAISKGNMGAAAAQTVIGEIVGLVSTEMSVSPAVVGNMMGLTGTSAAIAGQVAGTINAIAAPVNSAISSVTSEVASIGANGGMAAVAAEAQANGVSVDGSASNATTGGADFGGSYGDNEAQLAEGVLTAAESQKEELEAIALIINGAAEYDAKYDYNGDGEVTRADLQVRAERAVVAARPAPSGPSTSDLYWGNLYSDLQASPISRAPVTPLSGKQDIIDQYNADLRAMVLAGFPTFDIEAYKRVYGLTSDTEALEQFLDEGQFRGDITNNTEYQRAIEAVDLLLADPSQDHEDLFEILNQYSLPLDRVSDVMGGIPVDDLLRDLDSRVTSGDEVISYFNEFLDREPTITELAEYQGKPQTFVEPTLIRLGDIEATTFDGSGYSSVESAAAAASLNGYNNVSYNGQTLILTAAQSPRQQMLSPAASDAAFRKAIQPKPYDGSDAADQFTAARDAYAQGATSFTFGGQTYKVPEDMGTRLIQAGASEAEYIKARDAAMAEMGEAVSPPVIDLTDSKELGTLKESVETAVKQYAAAAQSGDAGSTKLYLDSLVEAQNAYQAKKDFIETKYGPDDGTAGVLIDPNGNFGEAGEYAGLGPDVQPAYATISSMSKRGTGQFMQWLGTAAFAFDSAEGRESTGLYFGLSQDNELVKAGKALEIEGESEMSSLARIESAAWLADVAAADGFMAKAWAALESAQRNPVGFLQIAGTELFEEAVPSILVGGVARIGGTLAALGSNAVFNAAETYGNQWGDTYDAAIKKGFGEDEARTAAYDASLYSALTTAALSAAGDTGLVKALAGDLSKLTVKGFTKETLKQYVTESTQGGAENLLQQLALNDYDVNKVNFDQVQTAAAIEGTIGATVSSGIIAGASALNMGSVIGVDSNGDDLTLGGFVSGGQTVNSLSDVNFDAAINTPDGNSLTLKTLSGAVLTSDPDMMNVWGGLPPAFFESAVDGATLDANEAAQYLQEAGFTDLQDGDAEQFLANNPSELAGWTAINEWADPRVTDAQEAEQFLRDAGYDPTPEEIALFVGQIDEANAEPNVAAYVDQHTITEEEVRAAFAAEGYTPTQEEIDAFVNSGAAINQEDVAATITGQADPLATTADEAKQFLIDSGYIDPTDDEVNQFVGQVNELVQQEATAEYAAPRVVTFDEAKQFLVDSGYTPTDEEVAGFVGQANDANYQSNQQIAAGEYVDPRMVTDAEAKQLLIDSGYTDPTDEEVAQFVGQANDANYQSTQQTAAGAYVDPRMVTDAEAKQFFDASGYSYTDEEVAEFVGQANDANYQSNQQTAAGAYVDPRMVTDAEARQFFDASGYSYTDEEVAQFVGQANDANYQSTQQTAAGAYVDPRMVTDAEARQFLVDSGYTPTDEEVAGFVGQANDANYQTQQQTATGEYAAPRVVTFDEAKQFLVDTGYTPTDEEVAGFVGQANDANYQSNQQTTVGEYVDPRMVSESEVRSAYESLGLQKPTDADIQALIGQYAESDLAGKAESGLDNARYNSIMAQLDALTEGANQETIDAIELVKSDLTQQVTDLGFKLDTNTETLTDAIGDVSGQVGDLSADVQAKYDALTGEQQALANALTQQGVDLNTAIETARTELSGQVGDLSADVQAKYDALTGEQQALANALTQQGVDLNTAIETARTEVMTELDNTAQLLGKPATEVTQSDIDAINATLLGFDTDPNSELTAEQLSRDANNDGVIDQQDVDLLTQILAGNNVNWSPPETSVWAPTGLYGEMGTMQANFDAQLAEMEIARQAEEESRQRQARTTQGRSLINQIRGATNQVAAAAPKYTPIYGGQSMGFVPGQSFDPNVFRSFLRGQDAKNENKMARGGRVDNTNDDFENILRMLQS
jgi:hypothetical protein